MYTEDNDSNLRLWIIGNMQFVYVRSVCIEYAAV